MSATCRPIAQRPMMGRRRESSAGRRPGPVPVPGRRGAALALLLGFLLAPSVGSGQDALALVGPPASGLDDPPEAAVRARVAAEFPDAALVRFRKIRSIATEAGPEVSFCGQVSAVPADRREANFHLFLYDRTASVETVRILGSESLNGYRVGRKLIGALRRVGCL
jgi:hypothetical protein